MNLLPPRPAAIIRRRFSRALLIAASFTAIILGSAEAQVTVLGGANFDINTGLYTYTYAVNNGAPFDLAIVNVPVAFSSNLMNLFAPTGFDIAYDPGVGIVSFFEDANPATLQAFTPSSLNGLFTFTSAVAPGPVTFDALDIAANTYTGTTLAPVIPEPASLTLLGLALAVPAFSRRRRSH